MEQLPVDEAYNFIRYAIQHHPEVAASQDKYRQERDRIPNQNPTVEGLPWCRCGECRAMPTGLLQEGLGTRAVHYLGPPMPHCVSDTHVVSTAVSSEACDDAHLTGGEPSYLSAHCVPAVCSSQVWTLWCRQLEGCTLVRDLGHPGQMAVYYGRVPWVHGALNFLLIVNHVFQSYLFFNSLQ